MSSYTPNISPQGRRPNPIAICFGTAVEIPLETKRLLVRVALAGGVSKGILAAQAVAMARSLLIRLTPSQKPARAMSLTAIVALLQSALMLLTLAQSAPNLPQSFRDHATTVANQAISQATAALASNTVPQTNITPLAPTAPTPYPAAPVTTSPAQPTPTTPSAPSGPVATQISIQSNVCNLANTNLKSEYMLSDLLQNGNNDGRIFMNAYVLDQEGRNYFSSNPTYTITITTSDRSNDQTANGSGATGPCGYYYGYAFYATKVGTYTITYSIPSLNLLKSVTITVKGPEKPVISSTGITVSTPQKETDYPISERKNFGGPIKYWFEASKSDSYITAQCSDADTPFTKVDVVSSLGSDGIYSPRGWFWSGQQFAGNTTCKFVHGSDNSMTITTESDPVTLNAE